MTAGATAGADDAPIAPPGGVSVPPGMHARIVGPTIAYWLSTLAVLATTVVRTKVLAVTIGASGVGVVSQLTNAVVLISGLASLGLSNAGIKLIAEAEASADATAQRNVVSFLFWAPIAAGAVALLPVALLASPISLGLLGSRQHTGYLVVAFSSVPLTLALSAGQIALQGRGRIRRLAGTSLFAAAAATVVTVLLASFFGLKGAVASFPCSSVVALAVFGLRERWLLPLVAKPRLPGRRARRLFLGIGLASLGATAATSGTDTVLRAALIHTSGLTANGLYQPAFVLSNVVFAQFAGALATVLFPTLSMQIAAGDHTMVQRTVERGVRIGVLAVVPLVVVVIGLRGPLIDAVFSGQFANASNVLSVQLLGELPRMFAYTLGAIMLPAGMVRAWLATGLVATAVRLTAGLTLLPHIGLTALAWSYVAEWTLIAVFTFVVVARKQGVVPGRSNARLVAVGGVCVLSTFALVRTWHGAGSMTAAIAIALLWTIMAPSRTELSSLRAAVDRGLSRRRST